jgi:hypothetical protein
MKPTLRRLAVLPLFLGLLAAGTSIAQAATSPPPLPSSCPLPATALTCNTYWYSNLGSFPDIQANLPDSDGGSVLGFTSPSPGVFTIPASAYSFTHYRGTLAGWPDRVVEQGPGSGATSFSVYPTPSFGVVTWSNVDGFRYTSTASGVDTFTLRLCRETSDSGVTFSQCFVQNPLTVDAVAPTPIVVSEPVVHAGGATATVVAGQQIVIPLTNDTFTPANGSPQPTTNLTYALLTQPSLGRVSWRADHSLTYVAGSRAGADSFTYVATDPASGTPGQGTVNVTITAAPTPPVAAPVVFTKQLANPKPLPKPAPQPAEAKPAPKPVTTPILVSAVRASKPLPVAAAAGLADTAGQLTASGLVGLAGLVVLVAGSATRRRRRRCDA